MQNAYDFNHIRKWMKKMVYDRRPDDMKRIATPELANACIDEQVEATMEIE